MVRFCKLRRNKGTTTFSYLNCVSKYAFFNLAPECFKQESLSVEGKPPALALSVYRRGGRWARRGTMWVGAGAMVSSSEQVLTGPGAPGGGVDCAWTEGGVPR